MTSAALVPGVCRAEQPVEEVFRTNLVYPQEERELQLTLDTRWNDGDESRGGEIGFGVEYGLSDAWQVELEWTALQRLSADGESITGIGDLEIGAQYSRMEFAPGWHAAFGLEIGIPIADVDRELSEGLLEVEPWAALQKDLPRHDLHLFGQLGLGLVDRIRESDDDAEEEEEAEAHELFLGFGLLRPLSERLVLSAELDWTTNRWNNDGEDSELYLTPGLIIDLPGELEAGFGVPIGLSDDADDVGFAFLLILERELGEGDDD